MASPGKLVSLEGEESRALSEGRGVKFCAKALELLAWLDMMEQLAALNAQALEEHARCGQCPGVDDRQVLSHMF